MAQLLTSFSTTDPAPLVDTRGSRSGYVYVAKSPDQPYACKVGHTARPPHARMRELGRTTWLAPMQVEHARFCWDALSFERQLHQALRRHARAGTEEWFDVPASEVAGFLGQLDEPTLRSPALCHSTNEGWLETAFEWTCEQTQDPRRGFQIAAWRDMERLSGLGYGPASWRVAERLMSRFPKHPKWAVWVLDAAHRQGYPGASLRRGWLASLTDLDTDRSLWKAQAARFIQQFPDPAQWHEQDRITWEGEIELWKHHPPLAWAANPLAD